MQQMQKYEANVEMNSPFSTWLIVAYGLSFLAYIGRFAEGVPKFGILIGMTLISSAYGFMFLSKVYHKKGEKTHKEDEKDHPKKKDLAKIFTIIGYSLAATFFIAIHLVPKMTFHVRYYDIFGAVGYATSAVGTALLPLVLPIGYAVTTLYYVFGSYQKLEESDWIDRIQLVSRTILALVYGVTAMSFVNVQLF